MDVPTVVKREEEEIVYVDIVQPVQVECIVERVVEMEVPVAREVVQECASQAEYDRIEAIRQSTLKKIEEDSKNHLKKIEEENANSEKNKEESIRMSKEEEQKVEKENEKQREILKNSPIEVTRNEIRDPEFVIEINRIVEIKEGKDKDSIELSLRKERIYKVEHVTIKQVTRERIIEQPVQVLVEVVRVIECPVEVIVPVPRLKA